MFYSHIKAISSLHSRIVIVQNSVTKKRGAKLLQRKGTCSKYVEFYTTCCGNNMKYRKTTIGTRGKKWILHGLPLNGWNTFLSSGEHVLITGENCFYQHTVTLIFSSSTGVWLYLLRVIMSTTKKLCQIVLYCFWFFWWIHMPASSKKVIKK